MRNICVFLGSKPGSDPAYVAMARETGAELARRGLGLVYGGSDVGCMKVLADACLEAGGKVYGVIPKALVDKEIAHKGLTELRVVSSMHERKAGMAELADAFVALPGGLGTLEELFEVATWAQLGFHAKPLGVLNVKGYYDGLLSFVDHAANHGFIKPEHRGLLLAAESIGELLDDFARHAPPAAKSWVRRDEL